MVLREWLSGKHAVLAALLGDARQVHEVVVRRGYRVEPSLLEAARARRVPVRELAPEEIARQTGQSESRVAAACGPFRYRSEASWLAALETIGATRSLVVLLDDIQDPHNLGAIVRTAEATGAAGVVIPKRRSAAVTGAVVRASAGASELVPIVRATNLVRTLAQLADLGYWSIGLAPEVETTCWQLDLTGRVALVVGSEGRGLRRLVRERCDFLVSLPMAGQVASLNASAAFAVMAYEVVRQGLEGRSEGRAAAPETTRRQRR